MEFIYAIGYIFLVGGLYLCFLLARYILREEIRAHKLRKMTPDERVLFLSEEKKKKRADFYGDVNPALVCPHCQTKGFVRSVRVEKTKTVTQLGHVLPSAMISDGRVTMATCDNCSSKWAF